MWQCKWRLLCRLWNILKVFFIYLCLGSSGIKHLTMSSDPAEAHTWLSLQPAQGITKPRHTLWSDEICLAELGFLLGWMRQSVLCDPQVERTRLIPSPSPLTQVEASTTFPLLSTMGSLLFSPLGWVRMKSNFKPCFCFESLFSVKNLSHLEGGKNCL